MPVDLHIHTTASDGADNPQEVVTKAVEIGLEAVAITDHDTVEGLAQAFASGQKAGIEIIPGVELGSEFSGREIHLLGYFISAGSHELNEKLELFRITRIKRMEMMIEKLRRYGYAIDLETVINIAGPGTVGRPHLAAAMVRAGIVRSTAEAFEYYIGAGRPAYVPRYKIEPAEAVRLIRRADGVPVLAHPGLNDSDEIIAELIGAGLAGLEAYHPAHSNEQVAYFRRIGKEYGLVITGGSDYHGPAHKAGCRLGMETVGYDVVEKLKSMV
ncbi:MAG TPA: PHP domain-containing protein [Bacillota bacterium]|nr:PHP domain-containing protein [Bacillota bacterium]